MVEPIIKGRHGQKIFVESSEVQRTHSRTELQEESCAGGQREEARERMAEAGPLMNTPSPCSPIGSLD
ncbi:unnamed protein product [Zymoseptoria tritici ST99CH_3D7]|uniref:Uncharacterized protein n=1 Tax=Zymoseptoria tritici (strain ST99CH_3D7) TaxID=1276538 RepID=A0A1X7RDZ2_ZYMT9|nr:unnamed protein product [Zymoseptoria tritici ST99CH_3D7]